MDCPFAAEVLRILPSVVARMACPLLDAIDFEVCLDSLNGERDER